MSRSVPPRSEPAVPITEFAKDGTPLLELSLTSPGLDRHLGDLEKVEHVVGVEWIRAVPEDQAYWEKGMFAIPISVCPLRRQSFTLEKVTRHFDLPEYEGPPG